MPHKKNTFVSKKNYLLLCKLVDEACPNRYFKYFKNTNENRK